MGQASVLTETELKRIFRIIETTRHAERNRVVFILSIYAGLRVGEIAALTIGDVLTHDDANSTRNQARCPSNERVERSNSRSFGSCSTRAACSCVFTPSPG